jgi:hypothetical protein
VDADGQPSVEADGDDKTGVPGDEDGVTFSRMPQGKTATITVNVQLNGTPSAKVDAFIDFNQDGDFADAGEEVLDSRLVAAGTTALPIAVPANALGGNTYARVRLSEAGGLNLSYNGLASNGEVEDYHVTVGVLLQPPATVIVGKNTLTMTGATPKGIVTLAMGTAAGSYYDKKWKVTLGIKSPKYVATGVADVNGVVRVVFDTTKYKGQTLLFQAFEQKPNAAVGNVLALTVPAPAVKSTSSRLLAAGGEGAGASALSRSQYAATVDAAMANWLAVGLTAQQRQQLKSVQVRLGDLPAGVLGETTGNVITLDANAAGRGWFVDSTPRDNREFGQRRGEDLLATKVAAATRVDLLTAVMHEMGHLLGLSDDSGLMSDTLAVGTRRLPQKR